MMILRPAEEHDAIDLQRYCWPERSLLSVQDFIARCRLDIMRRERGLVLVAEQEGEAVGFGMLTQWGDLGEISDLVVAPHLRSAGIGTAIIEYLADEAKRRGLRVLEIGVLRDNHRARILYERLGFCWSRTVELNMGHAEIVDYLVRPVDGLVLRG